MRHLFCALALGLCALMAIAYSVAGKDTNDPSSFDQAIKSNPADRQGYIGRGAAFMRKREWDKAISDFTLAIKIDPRDALAYEYRGATYVFKDEFDNAISDLTKAIKINPTNAVTYLNRGTVHRIRESWDEAIRDFSASLHLNPTNDAAFKNRAAAYSRKRDFKSAIADWNAGLRLAPSDAAALLARGSDYLGINEFGKAAADFKEAVQLEPTNAPTQNALGWLRATCPIQSLRDGAEAIRAAKSACELAKWKQWQYLDTLAAAFAETGDFKSAVSRQEQALALKDIPENEREAMQGRLSLYRRGEPYHQTP